MVGVVRSSLDGDDTSHRWLKLVGFDRGRVRTRNGGLFQSEMGRGWPAVVEMCLG